MAGEHWAGQETEKGRTAKAPAPPDKAKTASPRTAGKEEPQQYC